MSRKKIKGTPQVFDYILTQAACKILGIPYEPEKPLLLTETVLQDLQDRLQGTEKKDNDTNTVS
jgi:hypothetical protein